MFGVEQVFVINVVLEGIELQWLDINVFLELVVIVGCFIWEVMQVKKVFSVEWEIIEFLEFFVDYEVVLFEFMDKVVDELVCCDGDLGKVFQGVVKVIEWIYVVLFLVYNMLELMNFYVNVMVDKAEFEGFI